MFSKWEKFHEKFVKHKKDLFYVIDEENQKIKTKLFMLLIVKHQKTVGFNRVDEFLGEAVDNSINLPNFIAALGVETAEKMSESSPSMKRIAVAKPPKQIFVVLMPRLGNFQVIEG